MHVFVFTCERRFMDLFGEGGGGGGADGRQIVLLFYYDEDFYERPLNVI